MPIVAQMGHGIDKPLVWIGSSYRDLCSLPQEVRREIGFALYFAQSGQVSPSTKVLKGFGDASVWEIVQRDTSGTFRAVYTLRFGSAVYVLHVFQKKSTKGISTPKHEIELIKKRLRTAQAHYQEHEHE